MIFADVVGHERPREVLARILASGRVPHALLLHGPEGVGKRRVAMHLAAALLCERPVEPTGESCGGCAACLKVSRGNHLDLLVVTRLPKDGGEEGEGDLKSVIGVGQIRELAEHASYAPREGPRRIFVVDPADRMNLEAQNALLKTLEEPPGRCVIVLVASRPHALLGTVRSRCFSIGFSSLTPSVLASALARSGMPAEEARHRAALSEGRPGRAISLDPVALGQRRDEILRVLCGLARSPRAAVELSERAAELSGEDEEDLLGGLELVASLLRDAARVASGRDDVLHADALPGLRDLAERLGAPRAASIVALADRLRGDLRVNVNRTLVAETLLAAVAGASPRG